jgi:hypothetical protein
MQDVSPGKSRKDLKFYSNYAKIAKDFKRKRQ